MINSERVCILDQSHILPDAHRDTCVEYITVFELMWLSSFFEWVHFEFGMRIPLQISSSKIA